MSEYQYYRFETVDRVLSPSVRKELRAISSRADINSDSFCVTYNYGDFRGDVNAIMLEHFDVGFYFANWGTRRAYITLPSGTIPAPFINAIEKEWVCEVHNNEQSQLVVFLIEDQWDYLDDEDALDVLEQLTALRLEMLSGDFRVLYCAWATDIEYTGEYQQDNIIPLIHFDFKQLTQAQIDFSNLFFSGDSVIRALDLYLAQHPSDMPSQQPKNTKESWLATLSDQDKNTLLGELFDQGHLSFSQAQTYLCSTSEPQQPTYEHYVSADNLSSYIELAQLELEQERVRAEELQAQRDRAKREKHLSVVYDDREKHWKSVATQTSRTCASGYNNASKTLNELYDAYQLKQMLDDFVVRYRQFVTLNQKRRALILRLDPLTTKLVNLDK
ncbi:hypothetical protein LDJ79_10840 [Vibrio tritonius]|uniref:Uncharacterized protein n=1 Tax=Vibrio tritonius TaxID=1435069 RepID=A0ABS7YLP9_9VIBR|nr:hypothetical protein [Vibrio tritonius]MCA2016607.1 hypothetical protein [Vibrio tritonius]